MKKLLILIILLAFVSCSIILINKSDRVVIDTDDTIKIDSLNIGNKNKQ